MSPFGYYLRSLRAQKTISLASLAASLNVSSSYLSALEHGKKGTPNNQLISRIVYALQLDPNQEQLLRSAADESSRNCKIASDAHPKFYSVVHRLLKKGNNLTDTQLDIIDSVIQGLINETSIRRR